MRALTRHFVAPLIIAAAVATGAHLHQLTLPAAPPHPVLAGPTCPAGTNWDDGIQACR